MATSQRRTATTDTDSDQQLADAQEAQSSADADTRAAEAQSQLDDLRTKLEASQEQARQDAAAHQQQVELLNTQLQLAQAAQGRATMSQLSDINNDPAPDWDAATDGYVVTTSVVTLKIGKDRAASRRFIRGARVPVIEGVNEDQIARLVQLKAIAPNDGKVKRATTARVAAMAAGAAMDDVAVTPILAYAPITVPTSTEAERAQQASDAEGTGTGPEPEPEPEGGPTGEPTGEAQNPPQQ
jgi:hypothetical protein